MGTNHRYDKQEDTEAYTDERSDEDNNDTT